MKADDVRRIAWVPFKDWSKLSATKMHPLMQQYYVSEEDVDRFVSNLLHDFSHKLQIPYVELKKIMEEKNRYFLNLKRFLFSSTDCCSRHNAQLRELQEALRVPSEDNLTSCLNFFNSLSDIEKVIFLERIGYISVRVTNIPIVTVAENGFVSTQGEHSFPEKSNLK